LRGNLITIKIKDEEIYRKCKLLFRLNGLVVETLFMILFERLEVVDLQRAYIEGGEEEVRKLIRESLRGEEARKGEGEERKVKKESKVKKVKIEERLDAESFW
jgi:hypothetical protein